VASSWFCILQLALVEAFLYPGADKLQCTPTKGYTRLPDGRRRNGLQNILLLARCTKKDV